MRLKDDFFNILSSEPTDNGIKCRVSLNPSHLIYRAHFPGAPITPGVCLLQMVTEILEQHYTGQTFELNTALDMKFKKTITPDIQPVFILRGLLFHDDGLFKVNVVIEDDNEEQLARMTLDYNVQNAQ